MMARITAPHFCAGIDITTRRVAPIIHYMRRWSVDEIQRYCERRGWVLEVLVDERDEA
jgi:hypothetical protein